MKKPNVSHTLKRTEGGSVLITSLVFLMILTMLVLSSLANGTIDEKLSGNLRDKQIAFQAAEAVLREAESTLFSLAPFDPYDPDMFTDDCEPSEAGRPGGLCRARELGKTPRWQTLDWNRSAQSRTFARKADRLSDQFGELPVQPRYIVEMVTEPYQPNPAAACEPGIVQITARGEGRNHSVVLLQSTYRFLPKQCL